MQDYATTCDVFVKGIASGPVGAKVGGSAYDRLTCSGWHLVDSGTTCGRLAQDPVATIWSFHEPIISPTTDRVGVRDSNHLTNLAFAYFKCTIGACRAAAGP